MLIKMKKLVAASMLVLLFVVWAIEHAKTRIEIANVVGKCSRIGLKQPCVEPCIVFQCNWRRQVQGMKGANIAKRSFYIQDWPFVVNRTSALKCQETVNSGIGSEMGQGVGVGIKEILSFIIGYVTQGYAFHSCAWISQNNLYNIIKLWFYHLKNLYLLPIECLSLFTCLKQLFSQKWFEIDNYLANFFANQLQENIGFVFVGYKIYRVTVFAT